MMTLDFTRDDRNHTENHMMEVSAGSAHSAAESGAFHHDGHSMGA
jgi:hypothetical protein